VLVAAKALAMAALKAPCCRVFRADGPICAARRSGRRRIETVLTDALATLAPFDVVLVDAVFGRRHVRTCGI
jgi:hypothetical protein